MRSSNSSGTDHTVPPLQQVAEKEEALRLELQEINRPLYCELCNKQYKKASEMEMHLSSYDHHHRKVCQRQFADDTLL
jgi:hypothetical protein